MLSDRQILLIYQVIPIFLVQYSKLCVKNYLEGLSRSIMSADPNPIGDSITMKFPKVTLPNTTIKHTSIFNLEQQKYGTCWSYLTFLYNLKNCWHYYLCHQKYSSIPFIFYFSFFYYLYLTNIRT